MSKHFGLDDWHSHSKQEKSFMIVVLFVFETLNLITWSCVKVKEPQHESCVNLNRDYLIINVISPWHAKSLWMTITMTCKVSKSRNSIWEGTNMALPWPEMYQLFSILLPKALSSGSCPYNMSAISYIAYHRAKMTSSMRLPIVGWLKKG